MCNVMLGLEDSFLVVSVLIRALDSRLHKRTLAWKVIK